jgi:hypothetical protein
MRLTFPASNWTGTTAELTDIRTDANGDISFTYADYGFTLRWSLDSDDNDPDHWAYLGVRCYSDTDLTEGRAITDGKLDPRWAVARVGVFGRDLKRQHCSTWVATDDIGELSRDADTCLTAIGQVLANLY